MPTSSLAFLLALASALMGSLGAAVGKSVIPVTGLAWLLALQYLICLCLLLPQWHRRQALAFSRQVAGWHLLRGLAGLVCFACFYAALAHIPLADGVLLRNAAPLWAPLVGLLFAERLQTRTLGPIVSGLLGVILLVQPGQAEASLWHAVGCLSGIAFALTMHATRKLALLGEPPQRILLCYFLISLLGTLPLLFLAPPLPVTQGATLGGALFVGLALFLSLSLFTRAYSLAPVHHLAPLAYASVLFAGLLDWVFWQHSPDRIALLGMLLIVASGLWLARLTQRQI